MPIHTCFLRIDHSFLGNCTRHITPDTYVILNFKYSRTWRTVAINGEPVPFTDVVGVRKSVEHRTAISLSPTAQIGGPRAGRYNLPWFNTADAALFSNALRPQDYCTLHLLGLERKDGDAKSTKILDILPTSSSRDPNLSRLAPPTPLFTIALGPNRLTSFEFPTSGPNVSISPSSTYSWRARILLPLIRYLVVNVTVLLAIMTSWLCGRRAWAAVRSRSTRHRRRSGAEQLSSNRRSAFQFWRNTSPMPSSADIDSAIGHLWHNAITRGRAGLSLSVKPHFNSATGASAESAVRASSPLRRSEKRLSTILEEVA